MNSLRISQLLLSVGLLGPVWAGETNEVATAWRQLSGMAGSWQIAEPKSPAAKAFRVVYDWHANDTVLLEKYGNPLQQTSLTAFHRDQDRLMATHYCAKGSQPRLLLQAGQDKAELTFRYLDATNLRSEAESRLVRLHLTVVGTNLVRREVYARDGRETESSLVLHRVK